nr:MAG TPA: hypothetical protein [Caudoviricetes sp.]
MVVTIFRLHLDSTTCGTFERKSPFEINTVLNLFQ